MHVVYYARLTGKVEKPNAVGQHTGGQASLVAACGEEEVLGILEDTLKQEQKL